MNRRDLFKNSLAVSALALTGRRVDASPAPAAEFPKAPGLTKSVAEFIVNLKYEDIPPDVVELGKKSILDGFGLALAGSASVMGPIARQYVQSFGSSDMKASIIGTGMKAHPRFAAFANGVSIHADDYDDTQLAAAKDRIYGLLTHPTVGVLPPAFAICEFGHRSGKDLMVAYHVGVEVECKIAEAISPRHYDEGFHTTGTCGSFGSVSACARLRGLNVLQTTYALGIAATEGGGFRDNFGSMTKPFQAGHAAENGTVAADLAALGWTAADNILEAPLGFFQAEGGGFDPDAIVGRFGKPWTSGFAGRLDQAASLRLVVTSGHGRNAAPDSRTRHQGFGRRKSGRWSEPRHADVAAASPSDDRPARQVQHGILHEHSSARSQSRPG